MNITEKEVITLASAMIQGIFSNPEMIYNAATGEEIITVTTNTLSFCRVALLRAGYTIYPIPVKI